MALKAPPIYIPDAIAFIAVCKKLKIIDTQSFLYTAANKDNINLNSGTPVTTDVGGSGFVRADATANGKYCVGILQEDINQNVSGQVQLGGPLTLADWTGITGSATLTAKAKYYLDVISGKISITPPSIPGQICQRIGVAVDSLTLSINIGYPILL